MALDLKALIKASGNPLGAIADGNLLSDRPNFIDSGSLSLNMLLSGSFESGYCQGRILGVAGDEATGKSYLAQTAIGTFLRTNPTGKAIVFDSEHCYTTESLRAMGIDTDRVAVLPVALIEEFRTQCAKILDASIEEKVKSPLFIVLDSLGMLASKKESEDISEGNDKKDMTRTSAIRSAFRVLTLKVAHAEATMLVANHTYASMSPYGDPKTMAGGGGLKYAASTILMLSKSKIKDDLTKKKIGISVNIKAFKSRFTREESSVCSDIMFSTGMNRYSGLTTLALECGFIKKVGSTFMIPSTGEDLEIGSKDLLESSDEAVFKARPDRIAALELLVSPLFRFGKNEVPPKDDIDELDGVDEVVSTKKKKK